jgi:hypothetical protein
MFWNRTAEESSLNVHAEMERIKQEGRVAVKGFHRVSGLMMVMTAIEALLAMNPDILQALFPWAWLAKAVDIAVTLVILYGGVVAMRAASRSIRNAKSRGENPALGDRFMQQTVMLIEGGSFSYFLLISAHIIPPISWVDTLLTVARGAMLPLTTNYLEGQRAHNIDSRFNPTMVG